MLGVNECDMYGRSPDSWGNAVFLSMTPLILLMVFMLILAGWLVAQLVSDWWNCKR